MSDLSRENDDDDEVNEEVNSTQKTMDVDSGRLCDENKEPETTQTQPSPPPPVPHVC